MDSLASSITVAATYAWNWFRYLIDPNPSVVDARFAPHMCDEDPEANSDACREVNDAPDDRYMEFVDKLMAEKLVEYIDALRPTMMFVHFDDIDHNGHCCEWGSDAYYNATKRTDVHIHNIFKALQRNGMWESTAVIITADHGGIRFGHGQFMQAAMFVPILLRGAGVRENFRITRYTSTSSLPPHLATPSLVFVR